VEGVSRVEADMNAHTLTVDFDDDQTSVGNIINALGEAGYTVPKHEQL
jgi:copper chaperone CopZ